MKRKRITAEVKKVLRHYRDAKKALRDNMSDCRKRHRMLAEAQENGMPKLAFRRNNRAHTRAWWEVDFRRRLVRTYEKALKSAMNDIMESVKTLMAENEAGR